MQIEQHLLFQLVLLVIDVDGVIVAIEIVDQRLDGGFAQVTQVAGGLARRRAHHQKLRIDGAEGVDHNFALHGLDRIHHNGNSALVERLETLLRVDLKTHRRRHSKQRDP